MYNINNYFNEINFINVFPENMKQIKELKDENIKTNDNLKEKHNIIYDLNKNYKYIRIITRN